MKTILAFLMMSAAYLSAGHHSWDEPPSDGQLYMYVQMVPGAPPKDRQLLILTHYQPHKLNLLSRPALQNGWWDVTAESLWKWVQEGSKLVYIPVLDNEGVQINIAAIF